MLTGRGAIVMKTLLVTTGWRKAEKGRRKIADTHGEKMLVKKGQVIDYVERDGCCRRKRAECSGETLVLELTGLSAGEARECAAEGDLEALNGHIRGRQRIL